MLETNTDTLREILKQKGAELQTQTTTPQTPNTNAQGMPNINDINKETPQINIGAGTNFIKDITDLIKSASELLNTDLGKMFLNRLKEKQGITSDKKNDDEMNELINAPHRQEPPTTQPQQQPTPQTNNKNKTSEELKKMENEYENKAKEILTFTETLLDNAIKQNEKISCAELLQELKTKKEDNIKALSEVFKNGAK